MANRGGKRGMTESKFKYVFNKPTKEELETKIKSITDIVETNLKRIVNDLKELL